MKLRMRLAFSGAVLSSCLACAPVAAETATRAAVSPSGIPFYYTAMPDAPQSAIALVWKHGLETAPIGKESAAALAANLIADGPNGVAKGEFYETMSDLKLNLHFYSKMGQTALYVAAPAKKFSAAVAAAAPMLTDPRIDDRHVLRLRKSLANAHRQALEHPETMAAHIAAAAWLGDSPQTRANEPTLIEAMTPDDINAWRKQAFSRDDVIVVAAGAADEAAFGRAVDQLMQPLPAYHGPASMPPPPKDVHARTIVLETDAPQTGLAILSATHIAAPLDYAAANLANQTLGGGIAARLSVALRQDLGATYGVESAISRELGEPLPLFIASALDTSKAAAALTRLRAEYSRWRADGVSAEEVDGARGQVLQQEEQSMREPVWVALGIASGLARGLTPEQVDHAQERIASLSAAEVNAAITAQFTGDSVTAIVTPKADGFAADCVIHALAELAKCLAP